MAGSVREARDGTRWRVEHNREWRAVGSGPVRVRWVRYHGHDSKRKRRGGDGDGDGGDGDGGDGSGDDIVLTWEHSIA